MAAATIRDVAKHAGVGVGTVSRVLNESKFVSETTRRKVLAAIEALNYSPNLAARRLSRGKTMTLGVIVPFFTSPSVVRRLQGVISELTDSNYDLVLFDVERAGKQRAFLRQIVRRELVDGLLIISLTPTDEDIDAFEEANVPVVLVDAHHPLLSRVVVDNVYGGYVATKHLINLGHRQIGYLSDLMDSPFNGPVKARYQGYRQALAEAGIPFEPRYHRAGVLSREEAKCMALEMFREEDPPTAVFAYCDIQAIGIIDALTELNLNVPKDVSVVGFDNIEIAEFVQLTTIRQALYRSGVRGTELILSEMESPTDTPTEIKLPIELVVRNTTAPPLVTADRV